MAIIAILILIAVPMFSKYLEKAKKTREMADASTIYKASVAAVLEDYTLPESSRTLVRALSEYPTAINSSQGRNNIQKQIIDRVQGKIPTTQRNNGVLVFGYDNNWGPLTNNNAGVSSWYQGGWRVYLRVPDSAPADRTPGHVIPTADIYALSPDNYWYINGKPTGLAFGQQ